MKSAGPGVITPEMLREILAVRRTPAEGTSVAADLLPSFECQTVAECIKAFREAYAVRRKNYWLLAAIAFHLERGVGGRPKRDDEGVSEKAKTQIQIFCEKVGISRNTFQRLTRTYGVFAQTRTTSGTRFIGILSFKHHEVAARLCDSPEEAVNAIAFVPQYNWSANTLEQALKLAYDKPESRPDPMNRWLRHRNPKKKMKEFLDNFFVRLARIVDNLPVSMRCQVPYRLWQLSEHVKRSLPPKDDAPEYVRDLAPDFSDPIGDHDVEVVQ